MDEQAVLLHALRLRGPVEAADGPVADALVERGLAVRKRRLLALTSDGREAAAASARLPAGSADEARARLVYVAFLPLNAELLQICTHWQVRPGGAPNDHTDPAYDWALVERLRSLDERVGPSVRRLAAMVTRFEGYRDRLRAALARVEDGGQEWLTSPGCDSYHTVWMQLHEDLLLALGLERGREPSDT